MVLKSVKNQVNNQVEDKAVDIVIKSFEGIKDKGGNPYHEHCIRVSEYTKELGGTDDEVIAAVLHDLIEDTDWTIDDLTREGFSDRVIELVDKLTRPKGITYMDYIRSIANSGDIGLIKIKLADNRDNSNPDRIKQLPESERSIIIRYNKARKILEEALPWDIIKTSILAEAASDKRNRVVYHNNYTPYYVPEIIVKDYNKIMGTNYEDSWSMDSVPRHDKLLVYLFEKYMESDNNTNFSIAEIKGDRYIVNEYDGLETVIEPEDINWIKIENSI